MNIKDILQIMFLIVALISMLIGLTGYMVFAMMWVIFLQLLINKV